MSWRLESSKSKSSIRSGFKSFSKLKSKSWSVNSTKSLFKKDDTKVGDKATTPSNDKLNSLKTFHWANGLCFVCGEKWIGKNHQCPTHIPIHVIQELIDPVQGDIVPKYEYDAEVTF